MHPPVPRTWTVELRPQRGGPVLFCPRCSPEGQALQATSARPAALAHLARHARRDVLPAHLRICQCHERGCRWHPRHRGCAGPVLLVLSREHGGRIWRLADACAACAGATLHAAVVPDTALMHRPPDATSLPGRVKRNRQPRDPSEQVRVRDMLSYLAAALPAHTSPEARLLALQCALRADTRGQVRIPPGFLRSMRLLAHSPVLWQELEQVHWLRRLSQNTSRPCEDAVTFQLFDALTQAPSRPDRHRAADWALRTATRPLVRTLPAATRLTATALAAHHPGSDRTGTEAERLTRACGLDTLGLHTSLDELIAAGVVTAWTYDPDTEELHWRTGTATTGRLLPGTNVEPDSRLSSTVAGATGEPRQQPG